MATDPDDGDDDQWRFSLDDLDDADESDGNVAGTFAPEDDIEAGDIDRENAVFVFAGMLLALLVIAGFVIFL